MKPHTNVTVSISTRQWLALADKRLNILRGIIKDKTTSEIFKEMANEEWRHLGSMYDMVESIASFSNTLTISVEDLNSLISETV